MNISITIPDEVVSKLEDHWGDLTRRTLEALAIEAYRTGILTHTEVQKMLNLSSRWETDQFLKQMQAYLDYNEDDLLEDVKHIRQEVHE